ETATDELRYEGPIRFEDEPLEAPYSEAGSGRTLFTTALIGGAAILIIGIALYLRDEPLGAGIARLDEASEVPVEPGAGAVLGVETPAFEGDAATSLTDADTRGLEDTGLRPLPGASAVADARPAIETPLPAQRSAPAPRPSADVAVARAEPRPAAARSTPPARPEPAPATALAANSPAAAGLAAGLSDLVEAGRLAEAARMARERAQFAPGGSWTLQVLFACQASTVSSAFREDAGSRLMLFPVERPATSCYRLTWGVFPSRDAALAQATHVPAHFRQSERPLPIALERAAGL
ncbi:MAG: hypothetical protein OEQ13_04260, partial [Acidobacteriota bacterium]|nr:hypothetical protein [Acidobacteriota bacterium]